MLPTALPRRTTNPCFCPSWAVAISALASAFVLGPLSAVAAAAAKGEPIKVTVAGSGVSTDATDQTITIPQKTGAAVEIAFATAPSGTDSNAFQHL